MAIWFSLSIRYLWLILGGACFLLAAKTKLLKFIWAALAAILTFLIVASPRAAVCRILH